MTKCIWLYWSISKSGIKLGTQAVVFIFKFFKFVIILTIIWHSICFLDYTPLGNLDQQLILSDHKVFNFGKQLGTSNHATLHPNHHTLLEPVGGSKKMN